jgi:hypothetical protein
MNPGYRYSGRMSTLQGRLLREHETFRCMARIYCSHQHGNAAGGLCPDCESLLQYAQRRLEKCPYGAAKPTCANCPIHCYKPAQREAARAIMGFAGPRMPWRHPVRAFTHLCDRLRRVEHPLTLRRRRDPADPVQGFQASDRNQDRPAPSKPYAGS